MFAIHFLLCNLVIIILLGLILLVKKILKKHLTISSQYHLWYIFVCAAIIPFIPLKSITPASLLQRIQYLFYPEAANTLGSSMKPLDNAAFPTQLGISDFAASYGSSALNQLNSIFIPIWIIGCLITILYFAYNIIKIYSIRKSAYLISKENEPDLYRQYSECLNELRIKRKVSLYASCNMSSPVSYGLLHPKVIIPQDMDILLSNEDVRFIFLHELLHYRHKDAALNYITCILQVIYWFNPFIWYGFRELQKDREIACDSSVIHIVGKSQSTNYGYTLIKYAQRMQHNAFLSPLSRLGGEKKVRNYGSVLLFQRHWKKASSITMLPIENGMVKEENIQAIKNSLFVSDISIGRLYGKTGTGVVDGQNSNGWFIGLIEHGERVYCLATNLQNADNATGSTATEIAIEILNSIFS